MTPQIRTSEIIFPKPRYTVPECLILLGESRDRFYGKVRSGRYLIIKDGRRTYMLHEQLLGAAQGDGGQQAA